MNLCLICINSCAWRHNNENYNDIIYHLHIQKYDLFLDVKFGKNNRHIWQLCLHVEQIITKEYMEFLSQFFYFLRKHIENLKNYGYIIGAVTDRKFVVQYTFSRSFTNVVFLLTLH
jgi:hypothetical protein